MSMKKQPSSGFPLPAPATCGAAALILAAALPFAAAAHAETLPETLAAGPPGHTIESVALLPPGPVAFGLGLDRNGSRNSDSEFGAGPAPAVSSDWGCAPLPPGIPTLAAFPSRVGRDFVRMVARPLEFDTADLTRFAVGAGAVGVVAVFDTRIRTSVQAHRSAGSSSFANTIRPLGTWGGLAAMGVAWVAGAVFEKPELAATGADGIEASLFSAGFVTPVLKELVGRPRPGSGNGAGDVEPVSRNASFPSGEATEAFTVAAVIAAHTESAVLRGVVWGLAGLVGWERVTLDAHWASDVVAGALIGTAVGTWVTGIRRGEEGTHRVVMVMPLVGPHSLGLSAAVAW
jgi:membrane-associated phospholipid phosphatase